MKRQIEQIIERNTEGNYLLSSTEKAQMVSEILDLSIFSKRRKQLIAFGEKVMEAVTDNPNWSLEGLADDFESNL